MATPNVLSYAELFEQTLDKQMLQELTSAWMEPNASQVRYTGGGTVQIPKLELEGLGTYSRSTGFPDGAATLTWEPRTLTMDRGKEFNIDAQDVDETAFVVQAGTIMGEFQRTKVAPEVDAYRYSQIFQLANQKLKTGAYTPAAASVFSTLKGNIKDIQDVIGESEPLVVCISFTAADLLDRSSEFNRNVEMVDFAAGGISTKVRALDGVPLIRVPSVRFKSAYTFSSTNGFTASSVAMSINWIIIPRSAALAVVKTDKVRIFTPDQNQDMDAWKVQYRKYHDVWIKDNAFDAIYVSYTAIAAPALTATVATGAVSGTTKFTATAGTGNSLAYLLQAGAITDPLYNDVPTGLTAYVSGTDIAATATNHLGMYVLDATGHVLKFSEVTLAAGDINPGT